MTSSLTLPKWAYRGLLDELQYTYADLEDVLSEGGAMDPALFDLDVIRVDLRHEHNLARCAGCGIWWPVQEFRSGDLCKYCNNLQARRYD